MAPTTRRHLLTTAGALSLVGLAAAVPALPAAHPDAAIVALADRFLAVEAQRDAVDFDPDDEASEARMMALIDVQSDILDEMSGLTASTLVGHRARAICLSKWWGITEAGDSHSEIEGPHVAALFRDLLGVGAA